MEKSKSFVRELIDSDAIGISHVDGQWKLVQLGNHIQHRPGRETETPEQAFEHFVEALRSAKRSGDFCQLIFRHVEEVKMFLALDARRLREVQDYVRSARRSRNLMVTSLPEILKLIGGGVVPVESTLWLDSLSLNDFVVPAHGASPLISMRPSNLLDLDSCSQEEREVSKFHFSRYLANSDLLIRALESPSEYGVPLAVVARQCLEAGLDAAFPDVTTFLVANAENPGCSFLSGPDSVQLPEGCDQEWWVIPLGYGLDTFCRFRWKAPAEIKVMPLDVALAA